MIFSGTSSWFTVQISIKGNGKIYKRNKLPISVVIFPLNIDIWLLHMPDLNSY